jgi:hypothetical protein
VLDRDLRLTSVAISSTSSSLSDWVAVRWPRPMRILMISGIGTPSACERSTLTPDSTETGPVGGGAGGRGSRLRWLS